MEKRKDRLNDPIETIKGVGSKISAKFKKRGLETVEDIFYLLPVRYEDRRDICNICDVKEGTKVSVLGEVAAYKSLFFRHSRKKAFEIVVDDGTGSLSIKLFQWNNNYLRNICHKGNRLLLSGEISRFGVQLQMVHPDIAVIDDEGEITNYQMILPVYPEIEGMKQGVLRNIMRQAFEDFGGYIRSVVPGWLEKRYGMISLAEAFRRIHLPVDSDDRSQRSGFNEKTESRGLELEPYIAKFKNHGSIEIRRLIFEEYFLFQMVLLINKREIKADKGIRFKTDSDLLSRFLEIQPFELTDAQKKVLKEIKHDMGMGEPMNRLLQGDVGCGKTICAVLASCVAIDNGYQVAFMAPTEILAEQHYLSVHRFFDEVDIPVVLLRGGLGKERKNIIEGISKGDVSVVIGTHALIQKDVQFHRLGLIIIDEQHRFGVMQRKKLRIQGVEDSRNQGNGQDQEVKKTPTGFKPSAQATRRPVPQPPSDDFVPHTLVMTATPIPRTLSMVIFGDLDVSTIDELPKGRQKIWTKVYFEKDKPAVYRMMEEEAKKGNKVYIVYPLVEESDKMDLLNVKEMAGYLQKEVFPNLRIDILHGRMKPDEKEKTMERFRSGKIDILVCTTVIEVGVDVPDATLIVIEHAERFGLSQLHQLRGRVGRSSRPSKCILITSTQRTDLATKRLKAMENTTDGFEIAEKDMEIRGPGDILGVRQAGLPDFRVGNIVKDIDMMIEVRKVAEEALDVLNNDELDIIKDKANNRWKMDIHLVDVA
ncbi:MAG TPA: ATP-dependent DNA helicase RecG [Syntrophorhabdaceae bacterium]|nr:ATP-dependent DNA helicase RecG [Syntrophorhabdaceae bacterium]